MSNAISLNSKDFDRLSAFIHAEYGIRMPPVKKVLLESRLQKRLRSLNFADFREYCDYLFSPEGRSNELLHFIDKITTNKTDFFREPDHFIQLTNAILPSIIRSWEGAHNQLDVWSAGCSTGEEPYTLTMVFEEYKDQNPQQKLNYSILATDISQEVLNIGQKAVYNESRVEPISYALKRKYLLRSKVKDKQLVKIIPALRSKVVFKMLNFMDSDYGLNKQFDIIFCRNVIIYFDKPTQEQIIQKLCGCLKRGGFFFQGHSESIQGFKLPLRSVYPTIYQKI